MDAKDWYRMIIKHHEKTGEGSGNGLQFYRLHILFSRIASCVFCCNCLHRKLTVFRVRKRQLSKYIPHRSHHIDRKALIMDFRFGRVPVLPLPCEAFAYFSYLTTSVRHKTKVKIAILTEADTANKASCRCFSRLTY